ncbi:expressed unknown protein [Seminavis robusta]|uniref:Uncharacterized protein n=1 Tax=Seminavis robusta TaxID=568900 RepID=A0A9N8F2C0_9STRA|nr:expressed unknown protein [Seminavis robusta]|eukprot:Sro3491_g348570.1 n/a (200) ;mRNA; r:3333-3932
MSTPTTAQTPASGSGGTNIPLFGRPAACHPIGFTNIKQAGLVEWSWQNGAFSWLRLFMWLFAGTLLVGVFVLLVGAVTRKWYTIVVGCLLVILGLPHFTIKNWLWNANKQVAISQARFKSNEAEQMWINVDPAFHYQAKDLYFETSYGGKTLKVLRDGTIEEHGAHNDVAVDEVPDLQDAAEFAMDTDYDIGNITDALL